MLIARLHPVIIMEPAKERRGIRIAKSGVAEKVKKKKPEACQYQKQRFIWKTSQELKELLF